MIIPQGLDEIGIYLECWVPPHIDQDDVVTSSQIQAWIQSQTYCAWYCRRLIAPVLPALNEIRMILTLSLLLISPRAFSRSSFFIEPSSTQKHPCQTLIPDS